MHRGRLRGGRYVARFQAVYFSGNVLDLAVAVVMAVALGAVVTALVKDIITPFIAAIVGKPDFSGIEFTINGSKFPIGDFINAVISFILIAAAVYFFIVLPMNTLLARMRRGEAAPDPTTKQCPECLSLERLAPPVPGLRSVSEPRRRSRIARRSG